MFQTEFRLHTIGAFGFTVDEFFTALREHEIKVLVDVRWRRGMRGAEYAWANKARLEARCDAEDIVYWAMRDVAPPPELRAIQHEADKAGRVQKRQRTAVSDEFRTAYIEQVLGQWRLDDLVHEIRDLVPGLLDPIGVCLFCVEKEPDACHRSLFAQAMAQPYGWPVHHLLPRVNR
jgi:uncharacterized protein YeaO (DUF488 family)